MTLRVRSDSVSALMLVLNLKASGIGPGIIAREVALDIAESVYRPDFVQHVPGISNVICDALSRLHQPDAKKELPKALVGVRRDVVRSRGKAFFRTLSLPTNSLVPAEQCSRRGHKRRSEQSCQ